MFMRVIPRLPPQTWAAQRGGCQYVPNKETDDIIQFLSRRIRSDAGAQDVFRLKTKSQSDVARSMRLFGGARSQSRKKYEVVIIFNCSLKMMRGKIRMLATY